MRPVYINGIGIISPPAVGKEELLSLVRGEQQAERSKMREFPIGVSPSMVRRCPRQIKMAVAAAGQIIDLVPENKREDLGSILTTGYGEVGTMLDFIEPVLDGVPGECSPSKFSFTVPNSAVGQLCIVYGLKGPSTMLLGGDLLEYAALLLSEEKAEQLICGAVEEYHEDLAESVASLGVLKDTFISEAAVMLLLGRKRTTDSWAEIADCAGELLPVQPYLSAISEEAFSAVAERVMKDAANDRRPDIIFLSGNGSYLDKYERQVAEKLFPTAKLFSPKEIFGESFGSAHLSGVALAAAVLKEGGLTSAGAEMPQTILVMSVDVQGNYLGTTITKI